MNYIDVEPVLAPRNIRDHLRDQKLVGLMATWRQRKARDEQVFRGMWPCLGILSQNSLLPGVTQAEA